MNVMVNVISVLHHTELVNAYINVLSVNKVIHRPIKDR